MKKVFKYALMGSLIAFEFTGCAGDAPQRTPEEIAFNNQMKMELLKRIQGAPINEVNNSNLQVTNKIEPKIYITDEELKNKLSKFPAINAGVKFIKQKDGFSINDQSRYLDPEGEIINYGYNWQNGDVTYMIKTAPNTFKIKYTRVLTNETPLEIATVTQNSNIINVETITGKKFSSNSLILTSRGFITVREQSAFIYNIAEEPKTFVAPEGWHIAKFQNGDVASTKYLLLERTIDPSKKNDSVFGFVESSKELLSAFGVMDKHDYLLINVENPSKKVSFDITLGGKEVASYSDCAKVNSYVNKCESMDLKESLYNAYGLPNSAHYYWRILWFSSKDGVISVTREATERKVMITDLKTEKRVEGAYRVTGFPELFAEQDKNGKIKVTAGGGMFPNEVIEDAESFLKNAPITATKN